MFRRSPVHDACSTVDGPTTNTTVWTASTAGAIYGSPALANTTLFVGSYTTPRGTMAAYDTATGATQWQFQAGGAIGSTPVHIPPYDLLVFGADDGCLYGLEASTGVQLWKWRHAKFGKFNMASSPVFDAESSLLFFGTSDRTGHIFAVSLALPLAPELQWARATGVGDGVPGGPALSGGTVTVGANDGKVYNIDAESGAVRWTTQTSGVVYSSPAISRDGQIVFVGSNDGNCFALNHSTGAVLWSFLTPGWADSSPAVDDADGAVYFATSNGNGFQNYAALFKLKMTTGDVMWSDVLASADGLYDPVIAGSKIYAGSINAGTTPGYPPGYLVAWEKASGTRSWMLETGGHLGAAAALGAAGELYIGDQRGHLFKLV
eukprot:CAMPEP_0183347816 /NCGR_PEP_ID=MMETSP0164_2-20130417/12520_1 /TAXON_ID=221442 /ORGANISM="Coccolithus pelagicus ssp braarudi, Strain PLY182g" /LENGTH=376 /DNA_ID=CAMNT_0025519311 /DNA_START=1 /DNA_END=1131 /DNA_ORIENTATION=+